MVTAMAMGAMTGLVATGKPSVTTTAMRTMVAVTTAIPGQDTGADPSSAGRLGLAGTTL